MIQLPIFVLDHKNGRLTYVFTRVALLSVIVLSHSELFCMVILHYFKVLVRLSFEFLNLFKMRFVLSH